MTTDPQQPGAIISGHTTLRWERSYVVGWRDAKGRRFNEAMYESSKGYKQGFDDYEARRQRKEQSDGA